MRLTGAAEAAAEADVGAAASEPGATALGPAAAEMPWSWSDGETVCGSGARLAVAASWIGAVCIDLGVAVTPAAGRPVIAAVDLSSCATPRPGATEVATAPLVAFAAGGFTITGPDGGREAMAGAGGAETIGGAWRGNGTTLRGIGADPRFAVAASRVDADGDAAGEAARGAADAFFPAEAATMEGAPAGRVGGAETVARGGTPRPSRCSFCCWIARKTSPGREIFDRSIFGF